MSADSTSNLVFGSLGSCLHCAVWELLKKGAPRSADGMPIYNATEIVSNLGEVIAEIVASHPAAQHPLILAEFERNLRRHVATKAAAGIGLTILPPSSMN